VIVFFTYFFFSPKSPNALETARFPSLPPIMSTQPFFFILAHSEGTFGLWSSVKLIASPYLDNIALESPQFILTI